MTNPFNKFRNLGEQSTKLFNAILEEDEDKRGELRELKREFERRGFSPWMAERLAQEQYNTIHKNHHQ